MSKLTTQHKIELVNVIEEAINFIGNSEFLFGDFKIDSLNPDKVRIELTNSKYYFEIVVNSSNIKNTGPFNMIYVHPTRGHVSLGWDWKNSVRTFKDWLLSINKELADERVLNDKLNKANTPVPPSIIYSVEKYSPDFIAIYQQAYKAESNGLDELCGMGYRKALEFLVKDYLIDKEIITQVEANENKQLMKMIRLLNDQNLIDVAEKAAWLGNDFTHYYRNHSQLNLDDLRHFIDVVIKWILHLENHQELLKTTSEVKSKFPTK